eukprot:gene5221-1379_t
MGFSEDVRRMPEATTAAAAASPHRALTAAPAAPSRKDGLAAGALPYAAARRCPLRVPLRVAALAASAGAALAVLLALAASAAAGADALSSQPRRERRAARHTGSRAREAAEEGVPAAKAARRASEGAELAAAFGRMSLDDLPDLESSSGSDAEAGTCRMEEGSELRGVGGAGAVGDAGVLRLSRPLVLFRDLSLYHDYGPQQVGRNVRLVAPVAWAARHVNQFRPGGGVVTGLGVAGRGGARASGGSLLRTGPGDEPLAATLRHAVRAVERCRGLRLLVRRGYVGNRVLTHVPHWQMTVVLLVTRCQDRALAHEAHWARHLGAAAGIGLVNRHPWSPGRRTAATEADGVGGYFVYLMFSR